jgi:hypothetical protein
LPLAIYYFLEASPGSMEAPGHILFLFLKIAPLGAFGRAPAVAVAAPAVAVVVEWILWES